MRVVQLTDCHLSAEPQTRYRGVDARGNLQRLLPVIRDWSPDLLLATGDLSEDASDASYAWLAGQLESLRVPVMAIPGNHDDPAKIRDWFPASATELPFVVEIEGWQLVLLNTAVEHEVPGQLDDDQLAHLELALGASELPKLVALHHQPMPVESPWIDRYPLLEPEKFWAVIDRHAGVRIVTWGHVHHAVDLERNGVASFASPSTACNSLPGGDRFVLDGAGPACRWFDLEAGGGFSSGLLAAPGVD